MSACSPSPAGYATLSDIAGDLLVLLGFAATLLVVATIRLRRAVSL